MCVLTQSTISSTKNVKCSDISNILKKVKRHIKIYNEIKPVANASELLKGIDNNNNVRFYDDDDDDDDEVVCE